MVTIKYYALPLSLLLIIMITSCAYSQSKSDLSSGIIPLPPPEEIAQPEVRPGFTDVPIMYALAELPGGHISDIKFSESNPQIMYLAANVNAMGIWKSTDTGETWNRIFSDIVDGSTHTNTVQIDPTDPEIVYATDVHGYFNKGINGKFTRDEIVNQGLFGLAIDPVDTKIIYIGAEDGTLRRSDDAGRTWKIMSTLPDVIGPLLIDDDVLYAGTRDHGLFVSKDKGKTWLNEYKGIEVMKIAKSKDSLLIAHAGGIVRRKDGEFTITLERNARTVAIAKSNPEIVYAGTADDGVYKSIDGGATFTKMSDGIEHLDIGSLAIHPTNPDIVMTGTNVWQWSFHNEGFPSSTLGEGIYKTVDGGLTWRKIEGGFYDRDVDTIAVDPNNPSNIYVGTECSRGIYRSIDGGNTFEFISGGPEQGSFDIAHYTMKMVADKASNVYLTGRFGVTKSSDNGKSWSVTGVRRHYHGISVSPHDPNLVISGTSPEYFDPIMGPDNTDLPGAQIVKSIDGGKTWKTSNTGFLDGSDTSIHDIEFDQSNPNVVYLTTTREEIGLDDLTEALGVYKSADKGDSWVAVNNGLTTLDVDSVKVSPNGIVVAGTKEGVFVSSDNANLWSPTPLKHEIESLLIDPLGSIFAGTEKDGLFVSFDNGQTWSKIPTVPHEKVMGLAYSQGYLFAAVNEVGVLKSS